MRKINVTYTKDGISTTIAVQKMPHQRRFKIFVGKVVSEYIISDTTEMVEHYEGPELSNDIYVRICSIIKQYFSKVRAIKKIDEDDYQDYDDF